MSKENSSFIYSLDLFGLLPSLNFKKQLKVHSILGFYMTVTLLAFAGYALYFFGQNMFEKKNPTIVQSEQPGKLYEEFLPVPQQQVFIGVRNQTSGKYFIDSSVYSVTIIVNPLFNVSVAPEPCIPEKFSQKYNSQEQIWCFKTHNNSFLPIREFNAVNMYVSKCKNTTGIVCRPQDEIDTIVSNMVVDVFWNDISLDFYDYETPIRANLNSYTFSMLKNLSPRVDVIFRSVQVKTDSGVLSEDSEIESTVGVDFPFSSIIDPALNYDAIFLISLASTGRLTAITRRYQKIQDVIAQVVSIVNILFILFKIVAQKYTVVQMYADVSNECMDVITTKFKKKKEDPSTSVANKNQIMPLTLENGMKIKNFENGGIENNQNLTHDIKLSNREYEDQSSTLLNREQNQPEDLKKEQSMTYPIQLKDDATVPINIENQHTNTQDRKVDELDDKATDIKDDPEIIESSSNSCENDKVDISFTRWIKSFFKRDETFVKIDELKDHIDAGFDVVSIFLKLHEVDRLKEILLTDEQRFVFDQFRKPQVRFRKNGTCLKLDMLKREPPVYHSCDEALKTILAKPKLKQIDKNIIQMRNIVWN